MTEEELTAHKTIKIEKLRKMIGVEDFDYATLLIYLDMATQKVLNRLYRLFPSVPDDVVEVPKRYESNELNIACYLFNKRGAEGETEHNENGISRQYENADIPSNLLDDIIPYAMVGDYAVPSTE